MEVILDSSFVISCVRKNIDFLEQLKLLGFKVLLPRGVLQELKDLKMGSKSSRADRNAIDLALQMIESQKVKKTRLGGRNVDEGLIEKGKQGAYVATLDRVIKREVPNKVVIFSSGKKVGIERS
tara:strand:- start:17661 stop:18032 length:372 start_codon:yes stop_codon:yes gene_type:complete